jgi:hypothetical protein
MDFNSQFSILNSVSRLAFFQPIAVLAASQDLEGFVKDRPKLRKDRAATNAPAFVMLDLRFWDAHPIHFPIDVVPSKRQRFRGRATLLGKPMHET